MNKIYPTGIGFSQKKQGNFSILGIIVLFFFSFNLAAQNRIPLKNTTELKNKLEQQAKVTTSIIANFTQEKHLSFMKQPQLSTGVFYYQQSDKMRWEQKTPFNYVLLISNGKVRIKDNGKEKNTNGANKMMGKINTLMLGLLNGDIFNNKDFTSNYFTFNELYIVELTPKNKRLKSIFNTIELSFSKNNVRLKQLAFLEKSGDKSVMKFLNEKFNQPISESIFLKL